MVTLRLSSPISTHRPDPEEVVVVVVVLVVMYVCVCEDGRVW